MYVAAHNGARIWGGAERATTRLLAGLQGRGHRVLLFCNQPLVAERASALGVPTEILALGGDIALPHALRFASRLRRDRPDALVVGTYKKLFLASLGAHLARAHHPDPYGLTADGARREVAGKAGQVHVGERLGGDQRAHVGRSSTAYLPWEPAKADCCSGERSEHAD